MTGAPTSSPGSMIGKQTRKALRKLRQPQAARTSPNGAGLSESDVAELHKFVRRHQQNTDRLHRLSTGKSKGQFEHARDKYLTAFATRMCATVRTFAKKQPTVSLKDLTDFAEMLDVHEPLSETVAASFQPKSKGGFRMIVKSGIKRMAQQFMVRDLLTLMGVESDIDYARPGAGGEKAMIRDVCGAILNGYSFWQTADIKNYFASLEPEHLKWLPIPPHLVRNVVFIPRCATVRIMWTKAVRDYLMAAAAASMVEVPPTLTHGELAMRTTRLRD